MANCIEDLICVEDFRKRAQQLLPKPVFDFYQGGADDEQTLKDNRDAFKRYRLRPSLLRDVSRTDLSVTVLGYQLPFPIAIGPSSNHKLAHPDGEIGTAKGASQASAAICVSGSGSNTSLEDISQAVNDSSSPLWIQFYMYKDRDLNVKLIKRAEQAGYKALFVTVDLPVIGNRRSDIRNQFTIPANLGYANLDGLVDHSQLHVETDNRVGLHSLCNDTFDPSFSWEDLRWLRNVTTLPIVLKGILTAEDAKEALRYDVSGIVVSNHGGRQLDGTLATIDALSEVVNAVRGSGVEVFLDGGIRRGTDILKALALGAKAVFIARPTLWGLACGGDQGVAKVINILREELEQAMALSGCTSIAEITSDLIQTQPRPQYSSRL